MVFGERRMVVLLRGIRRRRRDIAVVVNCAVIGRPRLCEDAVVVLLVIDKGGVCGIHKIIIAVIIINIVFLLGLVGGGEDVSQQELRRALMPLV